MSDRAESSQVTARGVSLSWTQAALCPVLLRLSGTVCPCSLHLHSCMTGPPDPESPRPSAIGSEGSPGGKAAPCGAQGLVSRERGPVLL